MTLIRTESGLLIHSPSPASLTAEIREEVEALGEPRFLLAPNEIHNVGLRAFQEAYPGAHTTGCAGHPQRVKGVRFDLLLDGSTAKPSVPWAQSGELDYIVIGGNRLLHEVVLYHRASKTLIMTDALEFIDLGQHLAEPLPSRFLRGVMRTMGLRLGAPCMSPEHHCLCRDPQALRVALEAIEAWDYQSLIIAHGRLLEGAAAHSAVTDAFLRTIAAAENRGWLGRTVWGLLSKSQGGA